MDHQQPLTHVWLVPSEVKTFTQIYSTYQKSPLFCFAQLSTPTNLGQFSKSGVDLESAGPEVFKTPPTCAI